MQSHTLCKSGLGQQEVASMSGQDDAQSLYTVHAVQLLLNSSVRVALG